MKKFTSRKFLMAVVTGMLVIVNQGLGLDIPTDAVLTVAGVAISYILGEAYVDGKVKGEIEQ